MGRRHRNSDSWLGLAITSAWPVSAGIALAILGLGFVVFPLATQGNPYLVSAAQALRPLILLGAGLFAIIALVKLIAAKMPSAQAATSHAIRRSHIATRTHSVHDTPGAQIQRDPMLGADPQLPPPQSEWSLELIQTIEWKRFEDVCQKFYEAKGIRCACTPLGPDGGIDIFLYQGDSRQASAIVQCKAWGDSYVGVRPIRELLGVMTDQKVPKAFFMTTGKYSDEAKAFAARNRITLIDGLLLLAMIQRLPDDARRELLSFATRGDYNIPSCPTCGTKMRLISGQEGWRDFWGCCSFPRCRQKLGVRRSASSVPSTEYNPVS